NGLAADSHLLRSLQRQRTLAGAGHHPTGPQRPRPRPHPQSRPHHRRPGSGARHPAQTHRRSHPVQDAGPDVLGFVMWFRKKEAPIKLAEDWDSYICNVNDVLASIFVNLALHRVAPDPKRPYVLWVWVKMLHPRPDGLSSNEEAETLWKLDDDLGEAVQREIGAERVGTITTDNRREFYFYGPNPLTDDPKISTFE